VVNIYIKIELKIIIW